MSAPDYAIPTRNTVPAICWACDRLWPAGSDLVITGNGWRCAVCMSEVGT